MHPPFVRGLPCLGRVCLPKRGSAYETRVRPLASAASFAAQAVIYATCLANYSLPSIGRAAAAVLAHNGVEVTFDYGECCGMPQLEQVFFFFFFFFFCCCRMNVGAAACLGRGGGDCAIVLG